MFDCPYPACCACLDWSRFSRNARKNFNLKFTQVFAHYPFCSIHVSPFCKNRCFLSSFWQWSQFGCLEGVLKGHSVLSVLNLLHEGFKLCFSADWALHSFVDFIYVLACESPVFTVEVSKQSKACYSCICHVFFLEYGIVHFQN